jgi:hypothetical protein
MKSIPLFPRPVSWLSAVLLYIFLGMWTALALRALPTLIEIGHDSPRLAALGYLALLLAPVPSVGLAHHLVHAVLDRADETAAHKRGLLPGLGSLWAGIYAWSVIALSSAVAIFVLLALFPPPPDQESLRSAFSAFAWPFDARARAGVHTVTWVVVAAALYELERAMKHKAKRGDP